MHNTSITARQPYLKWGLQMACSLVLILASGCTQHHALQTSVVQADRFFGSAQVDWSAASHTGNPADTTVDKAQAIEPVERFTYATGLGCSELDYLNLPIHYRADRPTQSALEASALYRGELFPYRASLPLSPGDMLDISIVNGEGFAGSYEIQANGTLQLPLIKAIATYGLTVEQLSEKIELALVREKLFRPNTARVGVRVLHWAPIEVAVSGAVFQPGRVLINDKNSKQVLSEKIAAYGDYAPSRFLSEALRAASGVRPDAKLDQVVLVRDGWQIEVDLTGVLLGTAVQDIPLVAGDQVIVPTTGCFQRELVKPSQITPKGFRVFLSNLIETAKSNSNAAVDNFSSNLPYGTRLLQAAVSANCVGGTSWTNAPRKILLASTNPLTGRSEVIERSVEKLIRQAHLSEMNPYLMPNDAVACYDSDVTNLRDVARAIGDILSPLRLL